MAKRKGKSSARKFRWISKPKKDNNENNSNKKETIPEGLVGLIEGAKAENRRLVVGYFMGKFQKNEDGLQIEVPFLPEIYLDVFYLIPGEYEDLAGQDSVTFSADLGYGFQAYTDPEEFKKDAGKAAKRALQKILAQTPAEKAAETEEKYWQAFDAYFVTISYFKPLKRFKIF